MKENFNVRDKKGSIALFVLVGLLFMSGFLIILYGYNVNKSKIAKEQFNSISDIYSYKDGDANAYERAYTALRKKNKQTLTKMVENSSILELEKTYEGNLINYRIYGKGENSENYDLPEEYQQVEYIESTGTQYIDTGVKSSSNIRLETSVNGIYEETAWYGGRKEIKGEYHGIYNYNGRFDWSGITGEGKSVFVNPTNNEWHYISHGKELIIDNQVIVKYEEIDFTTDYNIYLFAGNNGGETWSYSSIKIKETKIYENDILIRDLIPCYQISNGRIGMYDLVKKAFYTNQGTGEFSKGDDVSESVVGDLVTDSNNKNYGTYEIPIKITNREGQSVTQNIYLNKPLGKGEYIDFKTRRIVRKGGKVESIELPELLAYEDYTKIEVSIGVAPSKIEVEYMGYTINSAIPSEYKELEYIESTGMQYIDTEYIMKNNSVFECVAAFLESNKMLYYGAIEQLETGTYLRAHFGETGTGVAIWRTDDVHVKMANDGDWHIYTFSPDTANIDGTNEIASTLQYPTISMYLFKRNSNFVTSENEARSRVKYVKIWENNKCIRDFVPCKRKEDGEIGLYDKVNNKFYTNAGTGEFIAGPEV